VQQLYTDISSGNLEAARQLFSADAADQFDPSFFSQFQQVSVSDLPETGRSGSTVTLSGVVTIVYPDNTTQSESRTFTVDTATQPALITGSSFGAVLRPKS
jgi:lipopolysaccharide assembly outer membrane protein LptD (OstA)